MIREESARLLTLIDDIISLSQMEESGAVLEQTETDLQRLAHEAGGIVRVAAEKRGISLEFSGGPAPVWGNLQILREMLFNLCDNAVKYNRDHGSVTVVTGCAEGTAWVTVRDTGIGIPERDHDRIFERFYRVDKSRSKKTGGTGLGLSIVKHAVEVHNGTIFLQSREGEGTEITIRIPQMKK